MLDRIVVTCFQACVLGAAWVFYEVCAFVIRVLSRTRVYAQLPFVADTTNKNSSAYQTAENNTRAPLYTTGDTVNIDDSVLAKHEAVAAAVLATQDLDPHTSIAEDSAVDQETDDASRVSHISRISHDPSSSTRVVFDSRIALSRYVAKIHVIGVVVWTTLLSIDYVLTQTSFVFALGMLVGNVAWVLTGPKGRVGMPLHVIALYWGLMFTLIILYLVRDGASALTQTEKELGMTPNRIEWSQTFIAMNVLFSPASCGFSWTFWMDARTLLAHYDTSLYTSVILSVPVLLFMRGNYLADILSRYNTPWLTYVILVEPVLKFMTIYTMTLSLDAESVVEMLTVNTSVVGICYLYFEPHDTFFNVTVAVLVGVLLVLHFARLTRRILRERRASYRATFIIED